MPAGIITTGNHPKALWPGVHAFWGQTYNEYPDEYTELFDIEDSDQAYEEDVELTGFGLAQVKSEGGPMSYDSEIQGVVTRYVHVAYSLGYVVTFEELQDNLYSKIAMRRAKANAISCRQTVENIAAGFYNRAFTANLADGVPAVSAAHPSPVGGQYSNMLSPAADLSEAALEDAVTQISLTKTNRGLIAAIRPESLHIAPQEWFNAERILKSTLQSDTANNNINVLRATGAFPKGVKVNHYFAAPHAWFIRTNVPDGLRFFWRNRPMFDKDNDFNTKNALAATYLRFSLGLSDWRSLFGSNGP